MIEVFSGKLVSGICMKCRDGIDGPVAVLYIPMMIGTTTVKNPENKMEPLGGPDLQNQMFYLCETCAETVSTVTNTEISTDKFHVFSLGWYSSNHEVLGLPTVDELEKAFKQSIGHIMTQKALGAMRGGPNA